MSLLAAIEAASGSYVLEARERLKLEVTLDELAELFAVFVAHVDKFHAIAISADMANHSSEIDLAQAGTNLEFDGIADTEFSRRLQIGTAQADGFHAGETG